MDQTADQTTAQRPLVIIHGWSDHAHSFYHLAELLKSRLCMSTTLINLAEYISLNDAVTYTDLATAMQKAWYASSLSIQPRSVDLIVHSTGALVVREWLTRFYTPETAPIKQFVMLAPANFGSSLAHKGRAFYGRVLKGLHAKHPLEVGTKLLRGLELASPYTFELAFKDSYETNYFGPGKILASILVGDRGFYGIAAAANEVGSDGTVRLSTANLNSSHLTINLQRTETPQLHLSKSTAEVAFRILEGENHSSIVGGREHAHNDKTADWITEALTVNDDDFKGWMQACDAANQELFQRCNPHQHTYNFQNVVVQVIDQYQEPVRDFILEFFGGNNDGEAIAELFHGDWIHSAHSYQADPSFRSLYINSKAVKHYFTQENHPLYLSLTAMPMISKQGEVGYYTFNKKEAGVIRIQASDVEKFFTENQTLLVKIVIEREQVDSVFEIEKLESR